MTRRNRLQQIIIAPNGKPQRIPHDTPEDVLDLMDAATTYISNIIDRHGIPGPNQGIDFPLGIEMPDRQVYFFILHIGRTDNEPVPSPMPTDDSVN